MSVQSYTGRLIAGCLLAFGAFCGSGCVVTKYKKGDVEMTRVSVFGNQQVGEVDLAKGTMKGYASQQSEVAGAIAEGVARGLAKP